MVRLTKKQLFQFQGFECRCYGLHRVCAGIFQNTNDQWTVGGKLKFWRNAIVTSSNDYFDLNAGIEQWNMKGTGSLNIAVPGEVTIGDKFESMDYTKPEDMQSWLKPSGMGLGFDLGFTYKPLENVTLSASLIDMGTIRWNKNMKKVAYNMDYTFDGLAKIDNLDSVDMDAFLDTLSNAFKNSFTTEEEALAFSTSTSPKFNLGAEYAFANNNSFWVCFPLP